MSWASSSPLEDPGVEREALAKLGDEGVRVAGVSHRRGGDRRHALGAERLVDLDVLADDAGDLVDRVGGQIPGEVDAAAQPRHRAAPLDLAHAPAVDVGHEQPRGVGAHVDDGNP